MGPRAILRLVAAVLWLGICLPAWAIARPFGGGAAWVRRFLAGIGWLLGLRVSVTGTPVRRQVLYVANHITLLDILALGSVTTTRFIAKSEIGDWPLVGFLARIGGTVFIRRERRSTTRAQADAVALALVEDRPVTLFAEGGTGDGVAIMPFRSPLFVSAREAAVPVQPIAIDYGPGRTAFAWPDAVGFGREATRMLNRRGRIPVTLRFQPPLDPVTLDRKALAAAAHAAIAGALG